MAMKFLQNVEFPNRLNANYTNRSCSFPFVEMVVVNKTKNKKKQVSLF